MSYSLSEKQNLIKAVPVFSPLAEDVLKMLASDAITSDHQKGEIIFSQGDSASGFHLLVKGRVKIFKLSAEGKEQILHIFMPGQMFGEAAVFYGGSFPANAIALEDSSTLVIPKSSLVRAVSKDSEVAMNMLGVLSARLMQFSDLIENLSLKEVPGRLAAYLMLKAADSNSETILLDITKNQLASILGTIPETLSRILTRLDRRGIISVSGKSITILNRDMLKELALGTGRL